MSDSFDTPSTKRTSFMREVESRTTKLDVFTDDFSPPGNATRDSLPSIKSRYQKSGDSQDAHDDTIPEAIIEQQGLDLLDHIEQRFNGGIKKPSDQFPGDLSLETKRDLKRMRLDSYRGHNYDIFQTGDSYYCKVDGNKLGRIYPTHAAASVAARRAIDDLEG